MLTIQELNAVKIARERYAIKLSPNFNCFDYIQPDEMCLSRIFADILNPKGNHAQGNIFLTAFLRLLKLNDWSYDTTALQINTEVSTSDNRRFDIELKWNDKKIVVENKPWASDQINQLRDYIAELKKANLKRWHLVYLNGFGMKPSSNSISDDDLMEYTKSGNVSISSYESLVLPWIQECKAICQSERYRWFLNELESYVLSEFKGEADMQERQAVKNQISKNEETLKAAFEISSAIPDLKQELFNSFCLQMKKECDANGLIFEQYGEYWKNYSLGFHLSLFPDQQYRITFQFDKSQYNDLVVGIAKSVEELEDRTEIAELMNKASLCLGIGKKNSWWPWFAPVNQEIRNWEKTTLPWLKIHDGSLAKEFVQMAINSYLAFKEENKTQLLK